MPVPESLTARMPQLAPWEPCRLLAWSGERLLYALQGVARSTTLLHPALVEVNPQQKLFPQGVLNSVTDKAPAVEAGRPG